MSTKKPKSLPPIVGQNLHRAEFDAKGEIAFTEFKVEMVYPRGFTYTHEAPSVYGGTILVRRYAARYGTVSPTKQDALQRLETRIQGEVKRIQKKLDAANARIKLVRDEAENLCPDCAGNGVATCLTCKGSGSCVMIAPCTTCNGFGKVTCRTCQGSGKKPPRCPTCKGTGKGLQVDYGLYDDCEACDGTGRTQA